MSGVRARRFSSRVSRSKPGAARLGRLEIRFDNDINAPVTRAARLSFVAGDGSGFTVARGDQPVGWNTHCVDHVLLHGFGTLLRQNLIRFITAMSVGVAFNNDLATWENINRFFDFGQQVEILLLHL
jgi:hypothetical protein